VAAPNGDEEVAVRIGIREIYDHVRDLVRGVDLVSRQIDMLTTNINTTANETSGLETRVRALETQKVVTPTSMWVAIGVLTAVAGLIVTIITAVVARG
jgi:hypothetical protein